MNSRICVNFFLIPLKILNLDKHEYASLNEFEYVILNIVHVTPQIFHNIFSIYLNACSWYKSLVIILSNFICTCMLLVIVTLCEINKCAYFVLIISDYHLILSFILSLNN